MKIIQNVKAILFFNQNKGENTMEPMSTFIKIFVGNSPAEVERLANEYSERNNYTMISCSLTNHESERCVNKYFYLSVIFKV